MDTGNSGFPVLARFRTQVVLQLLIGDIVGMQADLFSTKLIIVKICFRKVKMNVSW